MTVKKLDFIIGEENSSSRLDKVLSSLVPDLSRSFLQEVIKSGRVCIDGRSVTVPRTAVKCGMKVTLEIPEVSKSEVLTADDNFDFEIIFEDEHMLVINKPAGISVHPGAGNPDGTVVNALLARYPGFEKMFSDADVRPGIVHRLDKDTSGCLVIAKTPQAQYKLGEAFAERKTEKKYWALVRGVPSRPVAEISNLIGRHPVNRQKMAVVERNGKTAVSRYRILKSGLVDKEKISLLEVQIFTGRTHQIRVHMAHEGYPVLGDPLYGGSRTAVAGAERQMLHARSIAIPHPETGKMMSFTSDIPADMQGFIDCLEKQ